MRGLLAASFVIPAALAAQQNSPPSAPVNLSRADEIQYARSAAPADVSKNATVWVLESGHYVVAVKGTSGMACAVTREHPKSLVPICGDAEADSTVMAVARFETEERLAGKSPAAIKSDVSSGLASGRFRLPRRPALTYMTSSAQVITDPNGGHPTRFLPHLMLFYPNMQAQGMGIVESNSMDIPLLDEGGTPMSRLVIVVRDWTEPAKPGQ
ncbi:MAG TPA: hypothetical protein VHB25_19335 [Gemmatimonadaceae bacterium]|nr:hypothetical protein [Gemmatimonadaceae bacterium]